jgi:hypothetical protein
MLFQNTITWIGKIMVHMRDLKGTNRDIQNCGMGWGGVEKHEGQPVLEAKASVYRLGPRCRTQARCTTYK